MGLPKQVSASTYVEAWAKLQDAASTANGVDPIGEDTPPLTGGFVPRLSNGEACAIVQAWKRAAARSTVRWALWYELTIYALGWRADGDRFDMSPAHSKEPFPTDMLPLVWAWTARLALELDAARTVVRPLYIDSTRAAYEATARLAWAQMQAERKGPGGIPLPDKPPPSPVEPVLPVVPSVGFPWLLLLVVAVAVTWKKRR